jgi:antitoxin MazE
MKTTIRKWGNSLGLRIPKTLAEDAGVREGMSVELSVDDGKLVVMPVKRKRYNLNSLLRRVTRENLHAELDFGPAMGKEAW